MRNVLMSIPFIIVILIGLFSFNLIRYKNYSNNISLGTEIKSGIIDRPALLVFDIQEGTTGDLSDNEYYKSSSRELIDRINRLVDSSVRYNIPVIYVRNEVRNCLINLINKRLAENSPGIALDKRLKRVPGYLILNDKMDAFGNSGLDSILVKHGVNRLYFAGLDPAYSIGKTLQAGGYRNYKTSVIKDATISESAALKKQKLLEFSNKGCEILSSEDYFRKMRETGY